MPPTDHGVLQVRAADADELGRLRALRDLEGPAREIPGEAFAHVARLARAATGADAATVSLLHSDRELFLAHDGLPAAWTSLSELPRRDSLARVLIEEPEGLLAVSDARLQERVCETVAVTELGAVCLAAVPLSYEGERVGALCVFCSTRREWSPEQLQALAELAFLADAELARIGAEAERDEAKAEYEASEERVRLAFDAADVGMLMVGLHERDMGRIVRVNSAFCGFVGRSEEELVGMNVLDLTYPDDRSITLETLRAMTSGERSVVRHVEKRYVHSDGHVVWGALTTSAVAGQEGAQPHVISLIEDITERKQAELDLPAIANVLRRILSGEDARETIVHAALEIAGASSAHLVERADEDTLRVTASVGNRRNPDVRISLSEPSVTARSFLNGEPVFIADIDECPEVSAKLRELSSARSMMWQPIYSHEEVIGLLAVCWSERVADLSARAARAVALLTDETAVALAHREALERLAAQATTDGLTGLPNRRAWDDRLTRGLSAARRLQRPITLALLDMDRFKHYNDTRGHGAGDQLLREFGERARVLLREGDTLARWGGEEFAILLPDCPSSSFAESILGRIRTAVPSGQTCSVGYATWDGLESGEALVNRADRALYRAKAMGRDRAVCAEEPQAREAEMRSGERGAAPAPDAESGAGDTVAVAQNADS